jgi:hypothetical protein
MKQLSILVAAVAIAAGQSYIGRLDTVGGTTYDWQSTGPGPSWLCYDSGYGIHVVWAYSTDVSDTTFSDRNARYNFRDFSSGEWNWLDQDFMQSGVNVFAERTGSPSLGVNPVTHCAEVGAHIGDMSPVAAIDAAPGAGIFAYSYGAPTCSSMVYPRIAVSGTGKTQVALANSDGLGELHYSGIDSFGWTGTFHIPPPLPDPGYPAYAIAASKRQPYVCIMWTAVDSQPRRLYYRLSPDDGQTWLAPDSLPMPPAFHPGSDTVPSVGLNSFFPWYDPEDDPDVGGDDISVAAAFYPVLQGQGAVVPVELWHRGPRSGWCRIARVDCDTAHLQGGIDTDALYASRPTLGRCVAANQLICVWEQFDSANVEPRTDLLRADIWAARGDSTGALWGVPVRLTDPDSTSKRFPCVAGWTMSDTFAVSYLVDRCAGFAVHGQGPATENPIVVHYASLASLPAPQSGVSEPGGGVAQEPGLQATIFRGVLALSVSPHPRVSESPCLLDACGRKVMELRAGANDVRALAPGVYFVRQQGSRIRGFEGSRVDKVVVTR